MVDELKFIFVELLIISQRSFKYPIKIILEFIFILYTIYYIKDPLLIGKEFNL